MKAKEMKEKLLKELEGKGYKCKFKGNDIYSDWNEPKKICTIYYDGRTKNYYLGTVTSWNVYDGKKMVMCFSDDIDDFAKVIIRMAGFNV